MAKNPWVAALLSLAVTGLGQFYLGQWRRGLLFLLSAVASGYVYYAVNEDVGAVIRIFVGAVAIVDAYNGAKRQGIKPQELSLEPKAPAIKVF